VAANPDYFVARRLLERSTVMGRELPRRPAPLNRLPWDVAQDEFGRQGTEFLGEFGRLLIKASQDEIGAQVPDTS